MMNERQVSKFGEFTRIIWGCEIKLAVTEKRREMKRGIKGDGSA